MCAMHAGRRCSGRCAYDLSLGPEPAGLLSRMLPSSPPLLLLQVEQDSFICSDGHLSGAVLGGGRCCCYQCLLQLTHL